MDGCMDERRVKQMDGIVSAVFYKCGRSWVVKVPGWFTAQWTLLSQKIKETVIPLWCVSALCGIQTADSRCSYSCIVGDCVGQLRLADAVSVPGGKNGLYFLSAKFNFLLFPSDFWSHTWPGHVPDLWEGSLVFVDIKRELSGFFLSGLFISM